MQKVDNSWVPVTVCEIIGASDSFERAKDKLKRAEMVTDVNTDIDESCAKKRRRIAAAKRNNSESDEDEEDTFAGTLPSFPRQPIVQRGYENNSSYASCSKRNANSTSQSHTKKKFKNLSSDLQSILHNNSSDSLSENEPSNLVQRAIVTKSNVKNVNNIDLSYSSDLNNVRRNNNNSDSENEPNLNFSKNNVKKITHERPSPIIKSEDTSLQKYIIKALIDLKYKVNIVIANQNEGNVCTICKRNQENENNEEEENLFSSMFPIKNDEELQTFERFLMDEQNRTKLIKLLKKLGGQNVKYTVYNILQKCFALEVARTFSWLGRRNKKNFSNLRFCTIVIDVVQKHYPDTTNDHIGNFIKEWLRRVPEKCDKNARNVEVEAAGLRAN